MKKPYLCKAHISKLIIMETTNTIHIPNPSKEFVAFIEKAQQQKKERMKKICDKYRKLLNG